MEFDFFSISALAESLPSPLLALSIYADVELRFQSSVRFVIAKGPSSAVLEDEG